MSEEITLFRAVAAHGEPSRIRTNWLVKRDKLYPRLFFVRSDRTWESRRVVESCVREFYPGHSLQTLLRATLRQANTMEDDVDLTPMRRQHLFDPHHLTHHAPYAAARFCPRRASKHCWEALLGSSTKYKGSIVQVTTPNAGVLNGDPVPRTVEELVPTVVCPVPLIQSETLSTVCRRDLSVLTTYPVPVPNAKGEKTCHLNIRSGRNSASRGNSKEKKTQRIYR